MKRNVLVMVSIAMITMIGCTSEEVAPQIDSPITTVLDGLATYNEGYLVFTSFEDWEKAISLEQKPKNKVWVEELNTTGFISLRDVQVDEAKRKSVLERMETGLVSFDVEMNEYIMALVSPKGLVQIGDYIIRANWQEETAYVINASNKQSSFFSLLNEDLNDPAVMFFTSQDDVLELLEAGATRGTLHRTEWCTGDQVRKDKDRYGTEYTGNRWWWYEVVHKYVNGLVYYELTTKSDYSLWDSGTFQWNPDIDQRLTFSFSFEKCGGGTGSGSSTFTYTTNKTNNEWYRGSKKLKNYNLSSTFRYRSHLAGSPWYIAQLKDI